MATFPDAPLNVAVELQLDGVWTGITKYFEHGSIDISRGHPDESTTVSPSTCGVTLTNGDARFTSTNPGSPYYPDLMRNVPCRVSVPSQFAYLRIEDDATSYATCPNTASLEITGDIDIRMDMWPSSYGGAALADKSAGAATSWLWLLMPDCTMRFFWWTSGLVENTVQSTVPIPGDGRVAVRVTLAVSTGTVTFYTASTIAGPWTQLGSTIVAGATSVYGGTAPLVVGDNSESPYGAIYDFELYAGIGGTLVAHPDFTAQTAGTTSWSDGQGNTWSLTGTAEISSRLYRGHFEAAEWPQSQDPTGKTVLTAMAGGGLLRRQSQRTNPERSPMYRLWTLAAPTDILAAYWPMEDGTGAAEFASGMGGLPMYFGGSANPQLASNSDFVCSSPLPVINGSTFSGGVNFGGLYTDNQVAFLMMVPSAGELNGSAICTVTTTGTVATLLLSYDSGGALTLAGFSPTGSTVFNSGAQAFAVNGELLLVAIALQTESGGNVQWSVQTLQPGSTAALTVFGTFSGFVGAVTDVTFNQYGSEGLLNTAFGHCAVLAQWQSLFALAGDQTAQGINTGALSAWAGESAGRRFQRLCGEEGVQFRCRGDLDTTALMGYQTAETLTALLQECADADRGIWYELRQQLGWGYICRTALYNQAAQVAVDYDQDHMSIWAADPKEDDQTTVNDVTVTRTSGGSSARQYAANGQAVTGGRLSVAAPGTGGVGTYDQDYQLNLFSDAQLPGVATWILHTGTVDEPRYPGVVLDLTNRDLASLWWPVTQLELGERLVINNPPAWLGPGPVSLLVVQVTESLGPYEYTVTICGIPELPYEVVLVGTTNWDTDGTTLHSAISTTATSLSFATASGFPLWTVSAGDFPFNVMLAPVSGMPGELVTVTAITGGSSPQTATVTRSVNGVVASWAAGTCVNVWPPPVIGL